MTVSTAYTTLSFSGNGATTAFAVTWPFFTGTLVVTLVSSTGVETVKTITTHYTVSGGTDSNGLPATGTVTMLTAPASGETLRITRTTTKTQASTWADNDPFAAKTVEAAFDKLTLLAQEGGTGGGAANDGITGDVMQLDSSGAQDFWDGEGNPIRTTFLELTEASAPDTPSSGYGRVYTKTDGALYHKSDAGTEANLTEGAAAAAASATAASTSATNAATSATNAATSATNASTSATNAATSASNAATAETNAETAETNAAASAVAAAASATAAGFKWAYDTTTAMADPGTGEIRLNNATLASVTAIAVSDLTGDTGNPDASAFVLTWDDSTNTALRGTITVRKASAPQNFAIYTVTGASTDNAGWTELAVTYVTHSGSFSAADPLFVLFSRTGNKGADGVGAGDLLAANNLSDLDSVATALTNLGLGNVDNTSDAAKPVSSATQTALNGKQTLAANLTSWAGIAPATKLDASSYTAADVLTKLLTVDGPASGIDADSVDGIAGSSIVRTINGGGPDGSGNVTVAAGVQDVRLGASATLAATSSNAAQSTCSAGHVVTKVAWTNSDNSSSWDGLQRPIQKQVSGTWTTVSQV